MCKFPNTPKKGDRLLRSSDDDWLMTAMFAPDPVQREVCLWRGYMKAGAALIDEAQRQPLTTGSVDRHALPAAPPPAMAHVDRAVPAPSMPAPGSVPAPTPGSVPAPAPPPDGLDARRRNWAFQGGRIEGEGIRRDRCCGQHRRSHNCAKSATGHQSRNHVPSLLRANEVYICTRTGRCARVPEYSLKRGLRIDASLPRYLDSASEFRARSLGQPGAQLSGWILY
jgi:hypothetical protein